tara:strand:+ start:15969 stop:16583 length:615 start_codon:yes stop_codon:yes gene_type:complete
MGTFSRICASIALASVIAACSGIETTPGPVDTFAAGNYQYYKWRSDPLPANSRSSDPVYQADPILRRELNRQLQAKGYVLNPELAQFSVDYIQAPGLAMGEKSEQASNLTPYPTVLPNRQVNQAVVDNAEALGGVKETQNVSIQFNDVRSKSEVWQVVISRIVENVNRTDPKELKDSLQKAVSQALESLPPAASAGAAQPDDAA